MSLATPDAQPFTAVPRYSSAIPPDTDVSEAHKAAGYLRLPLHPQGVMVAELLESKREDGRPLYRNVVVQEPRRSSKTTSIQAALLGRCFSTDDYQIVMTAQTQGAARKIFLKIVRAMKSAFPDEGSRPFVCRIGNGQEEIRWDNGSAWWIVAPNSGSYRSDAADVLLFEEAGEYSDEQTEDLIEGAMPLLDTRPNAQVIVTGTPPKIRGGMLWEWLTRARAGKPGYGILDFSMEKTDDPTDESVWWRVHPGLASGLTTIDIIRDRFENMALPSFMREYLCADPGASSSRAIDEELWLDTQVPDHFDLPALNIGYSFEVNPDGSSAAISAAWYDADGRPYCQVVEHRSGDAWVSAAVAKLLKAKLTVVYDSIGANVAVAQRIQAMRGVPSSLLVGLSMKQAAAGLSIMMSALGDRALLHAKDPSLDQAVEGATFRYSDSSQLLGRRSSSADVAPLAACTHALFHVAGLMQRSGDRPKSRML